MAESSMQTQEGTVYPGFRFSPTDEELISHYLKYKVEGCEKNVQIIPEIEIWNYEPWELPAKSIFQSDTGWFFFSHRGRKYQRGSQTQRQTNTGHWKSTGKSRVIKSGSNPIGNKRTLVFYTGRAQKKGEKTEWVLHEYSMIGDAQDTMVVCRLKRKNELPLNSSPSDSQRVSVPEGVLFPEELPLNNSTPWQQSSVPEGAKADECFPKEFRYNDLSVEQIDSESKSLERFIREIFQEEESRDHKAYEVEECFTDIMKEDIVNLNRSFMSTSTTPNFDPMVGQSFLSATPNLVPAVAMPSSSEAKGEEPVFVPCFEERPKLKQRKLNTYYGEASEVNPPNPEQGPEPTTCIVTTFADKVRKRQFGQAIGLLLVMLTLLVLFLYLLGGSWHVKWFS